MQETQVRLVQSLGQEDPLGEEMATHSNTLARKIPRTEGPGGLQFVGSQKVRYNWATECTHTNAVLLIYVEKYYLSSKPKIYIRSGWHNLSPRENTVEEGKLKLEAQLMSMRSAAAAAAAAAKSLQSCLTLRDPMDSNPPGSSVHGIP